MDLICVSVILIIYLIFALIINIPIGSLTNFYRGGSKTENKQGSIKVMKYRIPYYKFVDLGSLFKHNYYIACFDNITDNYKTSILSIKKTILEVLLVKKNKTILIDILCYNAKDVRSMDFKNRLEIMETICCNNKQLILPKYKLFDNTKNFGIQFNNILSCTQSNLLSIAKVDMLIFKHTGKYFEQPLMWLKQDLLKIYGTIVNNKLYLDRYNNGKIVLENDEFPLDRLINNRNGSVCIYVAKNEICIKEIQSNEIKRNLGEHMFGYGRQVWIQMNKGLTLNDLLGNSLAILKKLHRICADNRIFSYINSDGKLLDIGSGRGANWLMWKNKNLEVFAVEPDDDNYKLLVKKSNLYNSIHTLKTVGQNNNEILEFIPSDGVDYITSIYSLTFFNYKNKDEINNLVTLINKSLKSGGLFMGLVIDGKRLLSTAKDVNATYDKEVINITCPPYTIKIYDNNKVYINIDDPITLVTDQWEYIVDFDLLVNELKNKKINLVETGFLSKEAELLNKCPQWFTKLARYFIFKKS